MSNFDVEMRVTAPSLELNYCDNLMVRVHIRRTCKKCGDGKDFAFDPETIPHSNLDLLGFEIFFKQDLGSASRTAAFRAPCAVCAKPEFEIAN